MSNHKQIIAQINKLDSFCLLVQSPGHGSFSFPPPAICSLNALELSLELIFSFLAHFAFH